MYKVNPNIGNEILAAKYKNISLTSIIVLFQFYCKGEQKQVD